MKLIDRYITRELIVNVLFAVAVLSLVLVVGNIFRKLLPLIVNRDVPATYLVTFIAYILPYSLTFTIPWGLLVAVLLVFGRLSADNELTALRSNGVSVTRLCIPLFVIAGTMTALCLWLTVRVAPANREKLTTMMVDLATEKPMALFQADQVIDQFPGRKIYVGRKDGNKLENIIVFETDEKSLPMRVTAARRGLLRTDLANQRILLELEGAHYQQRDEADPLDLRKTRDGVSVEQGTLPISLTELYENTKRSGRSALSLEQLLAQLEHGDVRQQTASRTEINRRFSLPFSCVAFALIAVPLGVTTQRRETSVGFGVSIAVAFSYFLFLIMADALRENPAAHPELLVWLPNLLFVAMGALMFRRLAAR